VAKATENITSDRELVAAMANGDADALRALSARYARMLGALAYRFVKDESDAEEIAADALWQAWREAANFDPARSSVSAWLVMLGRSRAIDRFRAARARRPPENPQPEPAPVADALSELETAERAKIVKQAVGELEARERELLELAYFSDLSQTEIADKVGLPLGTVKTRMRTALIKLRDALRRLR
jgi:RNA polymerase sigma-70 factor, ECF subfamily